MKRKIILTYDYIFTVQPTSPLIIPQDINNAYKKLSTKKNIDSIISVSEKKHLFWVKDKKNLNHFIFKANRQNLIPIYEENGIVVGSKRKLF